MAAVRTEAFGAIIAEAMKKVGKDGVITVEESRTMETSLEFVEGMRLDRGYLSPYFVTDPERMEVALDQPLILLHDKESYVMVELTTTEVERRSNSAARNQRAEQVTKPTGAGRADGGAR